MLIQKNNFITLQGWMVSELNLKGNELIIFAIIYGFSQDGESKFNGSLQYLADWTNSTKQGVIKNLKSLIKKNYIVKKEVVKGGIKFCTYNVNHSKFNGIKQSLMGIKQSLPNNIVNNIDTLSHDISVTYIEETKKPKKEKKFIPPTLEEVQEYIEERKSPIDAKFFIDYYTSNNWKDKNNEPVKNWKLKLITWEARERNKKSSCRDSSCQCEYSLEQDWDKEAFEGVYEYGD